ncbi:MAG: hypothetical protein EP330_23875 [Deltaproteobacteria bacterium]|nr:MAG: hypothetical protein EP330_23875 [Deltaproteobacteria bacterium]
MIPDFVTHYARGEPFRSVTAAGSEGWAKAVAALDEDNAWGLARFRDPHYLPRRAAVEARMRAELVVAGGAPQLVYPHYAFLGARPSWERPGTRSYRIALADIPPGAVSFTVGDSLLTWDPDYRAQVEARQGASHPLSGRLLNHRELTAELVPLVEVQLWWQPR